MADEKDVKASILLPARVWKAVRKAAIDADKDLKTWVREALEAHLKRRQ